MFYAKFLVCDTKFLVFDTIFIVLNTDVPTVMLFCCANDLALLRELFPITG